VPPQVNSTSSRWAAMASRSTPWAVTVPLRVRNAECGVRNGPRGRRVARLAPVIEPSSAIPHPAFRTPHWSSFVP